MGIVSVKASVHEIGVLVREWAQENKMSIVEDGDTESQEQVYTPSNDIIFRAKDAFYMATWHCQSTDSVLTVNMKVRPRLYLNLILHLILFTGFLYSIIRMQSVIDEYTALNLLIFILLAVFMILLIWWKDKKLALRLAHMECSFWEMFQSVYDIRQMTRSEGRLYTLKSRLFTEVFFACWIVYVAIMFLGAYGLLIALLLCLPIMATITTKLKNNDDPHWHWRLWMIDSMSSWTFLMIGVLAVSSILLAIEVFQNLELYKPENNLSVTQAIKKGSFRTILPVTKSELEKDINRRMSALANSEIKHMDKSGKDFIIWKRRLLYCYSSFILCSILIATYFFVLGFLKSLLRSHDRWKKEVGESESRKGPSVPYLPRGWKWQTPLMLRALVLLLYLYGGAINLLAGAFCFDGLSYVIAGRTFIFEKSANLWSWILALSKILFGETYGQVVGAILVLIICSPLLILMTAYLRRIYLSMLLMIHVR